MFTNDLISCSFERSVVLWVRVTRFWCKITWNGLNGTRRCSHCSTPSDLSTIIGTVHCILFSNSLNTSNERLLLARHEKLRVKEQFEIFKNKE